MAHRSDLECSGRVHPLRPRDRHVCRIVRQVAIHGDSRPPQFGLRYVMSPRRQSPICSPMDPGVQVLKCRGSAGHARDQPGPDRVSCVGHDDRDFVPGPPHGLPPAGWRCARGAALKRLMPTNDFVTSLKAEISQLEAEVANDPRLRKLKRLRETLAEYEPRGTVHQAEATFHGTSGFVADATVHTKQEKIKAELTRLLQANGRQHRSDILDGLRSGPDADDEARAWSPDVTCQGCSRALIRR
jgi:hypothetical protein